MRKKLLLNIFLSIIFNIMSINFFFFKSSFYLLQEHLYLNLIRHEFDFIILPDMNYEMKYNWRKMLNTDRILEEYLWLILNSMQLIQLFFDIWSEINNDILSLIILYLVAIKYNFTLPFVFFGQYVFFWFLMLYLLYSSESYQPQTIFYWFYW